MKTAAGHELKHKAAMSKAGEVEVGKPIPTTPETLRMRRGASVKHKQLESTQRQFERALSCVT